MFVRDEVLAGATLEAARERLAKLDGWFLTAADDAYREGIAALVRVGSLGAAPGISGLAEVRFRSLAAQDHRVGLALRWEVRGAGGSLFPVLDADLVLTPAAENKTMLTLAGTYRPALGGLGAEVDRLILHRVAEATIRNFLNRVASAIA
jgi:hypothetical protein